MTAIGSSTGDDPARHGDSRGGQITPPALVDAIIAALLFLLFTRLSDYVGPQDGPISINQVIIGLVLCWTLFDRLVVRRESLRWDRVLGWMLVYGAAIALSTLAAYHRVTTLAALVAYLREAIIVFLLVNLVTTMAGLRRASWALVAGGACLAAVAVLHAITGYDFGGLSSLDVQIEPGGSTIRLDGPARIDSNYFAQLLVTVVPLALYRLWDERRLILRVVAIVALALICSVIVWTYSRGAFLGLVSMLGIAVAMQTFNPRRLLALGVALVVVALATPQLYWERIGGTVQYVAARASDMSPDRAPARASPDQAATPGPAAEAPRLVPIDRSVETRSVVWRVGVLMFLERPLTGVGKGNYYAAYPDYFWRVDPNLSPSPVATHNTPVNIAAETGLLGLATFAGVVIAAVAGLRSAKRRCARGGLRREVMLLEAVEVAIYGYLVTSMFLHDNVYQRCLWLLIGLAAVGHRVASRPADGALPAHPVSTRAAGSP